MDSRAYIPDDIWQTALDQHNWSHVSLRDKRYDAVIHMVTAADGAEEFYNLESNEARFEGLDDARRVDFKIRDAYLGHHNYFIVDNKHNGGFRGKIERVNEVASKLIHLPTPLNFNKKFLIESKPKYPSNLKVEQIEIQDTFLRS
jgi:hypothetical protein